MRGLSWFVGFLLISCQTATHQQVSAVEKTPKSNTQSVVFIAGFDEGENRYYHNARAYFQGKGNRLVEGLYSLEEILTWLDRHHGYQNYHQIHIVSHSNPWRGMSLKTTPQGKRITSVSLEKVNFSTEIRGITENTQIIFHGCGLGSNQALLRKLKTYFIHNDKHAQVYASPYFNVFKGTYAEHFLARPYYAFYPTAHSKGPLHLSGVFRQNYQDTQIDWLTAISTRKETRLGEPYSYKFNIPVSWTFEFPEDEVIPKLSSPDAIIDFILEDEVASQALFKLGIPVESFRWKAQKQGRNLIIQGKTTALCVLEPIMNAEEPASFAIPDIANTALYQQY